MSNATINQGSQLGPALSDLLLAKDIEPGSEPSYQICKVIYLYHPLGAKMAEAPIKKAQSQARDISIPNSPEDRVKKAFLDEWQAISADKIILNFATQARVYGIASLAMVAKNYAPSEPIPPDRLYEAELSFSVFDPLNTAGSLVLNQMPNAPDFQKVVTIAVNGQAYHRSRIVVMMNEQPIYIAYTTSAFGYVGRSVYQRALYPLKSFVQTLITDDMVTRKAGLLIAMIKTAGSIIDKLMKGFQTIKASLLQAGSTNNVLVIGQDDKIETLNMQNLDGAYGAARTNILKNIATAADMPAKLLENETLVQGFGEGTEDFKEIARYIDRVRVDLKPAYDFFDTIVQRRAWNPDFYKVIQKEFPDEYGGVDYNTAFYRWKNSFTAGWPSLLTEPDSEKVKVEDVKLKAAIAVVEVISPMCDPENKAALVQWVMDTLNDMKLMFPSPLMLDTQAIAEYEPPQPLEMPAEPKPFAANDSQHPARDRYVQAVLDLVSAMKERERAGAPKLSPAAAKQLSLMLPLQGERRAS